MELLDLQHSIVLPLQLTNEERVEIAKRVVQKAAGRVPVVAGGGASSGRRWG